MSLPYMDNDWKKKHNLSVISVAFLVEGMTIQNMNSFTKKFICGMRVQKQPIFYLLTLHILLVYTKLSDFGGERELFVMERAKGFEDRTNISTRAMVAKDGDQNWRI